jgi:hypothetical protein
MDWEDLKRRLGELRMEPEEDEELGEEGEGDWDEEWEDWEEEEW